MTRPRASRNSLVDVVQRRSQQLAAEGRIARTVMPTPQSFRARKPGTVLHRVRQTAEVPTREAAAATFADRPWAATATWYCFSSGHFCWERPA